MSIQKPSQENKHKNRNLASLVSNPGARFPVANAGFEGGGDGRGYGDCIVLANPAMLLLPTRLSFSLSAAWPFTSRCTVLLSSQTPSANHNHGRSGLWAH
jgi:hypothetical protein